jgi:hypothetical protein
VPDKSEALFKSLVDCLLFCVHDAISKANINAGNEFFTTFFIVNHFVLINLEQMAVH